MKTVARITAALFLAAMFTACKYYDTVMHTRDGEPIARIGDNELYYSDIKGIVPDFVTPEDSVAMVRQYINRWATAILYEELAQQHLSDDEKDVENEIMDYYRSLLRYRYEQHYISDRLDTVVSESQLKEYYEKNKNEFTVDRPLLKVRFASVTDSNPEGKKFLRLMCSDKASDLQELESLSRTATVRWFDSSDSWMDAAVLAKEFGVDWRTMMDQMKNGVIVLHSEQAHDTRMAYVCDLTLSGPAPLDYCSGVIRDIILSGRKHKLLSELEEKIVSDATRRKYFEIYEK